MKIEKISNTQVKFVLNQNDLNERNIKLSELAYGSEKTQALFKEMMEQAIDTCGFSAESAPLLIEAVPVSSDSIMIIVSKVSNQPELENKFNLTPPSKEERKYIKKELDDELSPILIDDSSLSIYSFDTLDIASDACRLIINHYDGASQLYKHDANYFLIIQNDAMLHITTNDFDTIVSEYGKKHVSTIVSKAYVIEHGEVMIKTNAIDILANL